MRAVFGICASAGALSAAHDVVAHGRIDERMASASVSRGSGPIELPLPPACAASCQGRFPINWESACSHHHVFRSDVTRCVQTDCPALQDVLNWQTYYAERCDLRARDEGIWEISLAWALFGLATLAVMCRLLCRMYGPGLWWDDYLVLALWVLSIEFAVCLPFLRDCWAGRDAVGIVESQDVERMLMWVYISVPFYIIETYGTKVVWALLYMRVWEFNTPFRKMCWATIGFLAASMISFTIGAIVVYWPFHYYVDDSAVVRQSHLGINLLAVVYAVAAINIVMDFWILLLPVPKLMSLTAVTKQRKIGICVVFLLGFVVTATSIVRITYVVPLHNTTNVTWDFGHFGTWCEIEVHLGLISCNLPALAGLANRLRSRRRAARLGQERTRPSTSLTGPSNGTPPKTPKLDTWSDGSASTSNPRQSEEDYERIVMRVAENHAPA